MNYLDSSSNKWLSPYKVIISDKNGTAMFLVFALRFLEEDLNDYIARFNLDKIEPQNNKYDYPFIYDHLYLSYCDTEAETHSLIYDINILLDNIALLKLGIQQYNDVFNCSIESEIEIYQNSREYYLLKNLYFDGIEEYFAFFVNTVKKNKDLCRELTNEAFNIIGMLVANIKIREYEWNIIKEFKTNGN